jgi:hypothetical protein
VKTPGLLKVLDECWEIEVYGGFRGAGCCPPRWLELSEGMASATKLCSVRRRPVKSGLTWPDREWAHNAPPPQGSQSSGNPIANGWVLGGMNLGRERDWRLSCSKC